MGKVKVKKVVERVPNQPIIVRFEHADIRFGNSHEGAVDLSSGTAATVFKPVMQPGLAREDNTKRVLALQHERVTYIGSSDNQFSSISGNKNVMGDSNLSEMRTFIAIRKKKKMKIYEALPITVSPYRKGHSFVVETEKQTGVQKSAEEKKVAAIGLVKAFGSKMKVLTQERREKAATDATEMEDSLQTAAEAAMDAVGGELPPEYKDDSILDYIPPCNRITTNLFEVYKISDLLTDAEMDDMEDLANEFLNISKEQINEWRELKRFSDYFFVMWLRLSSRKDERKAILQTKLVLYTEVLICLAKLPHGDLKKKGLPPLPSEFPQWLVEKAVNNFTIVNAHGVRYRPDASKDKTCCYIFVLILLSNDFSFDVPIVTLSLQLHIKKLLTLARAVGITIKFNATTKQYQGVLRIPLPKPIERRGRARKMR